MILVVHLTSEPLADQSYCGIIRFLICLGVQKTWVFGSTRQEAESLQNECEEFCLRRGFPITCRVTCFASSTFPSLRKDDQN